MLAYFREPMNSLTHLVGVGLAAGACGLLLAEAFATGQPGSIASCAVFGFSLIILYIASTLFHSLRVSPNGIARLQRFDQMMVYVLIAGTYTPVCVLAMAEHGGTLLLAAVWLCALVGIMVNVIWAYVPDGVSIALCVGMGWVGIVALPTLIHVLPFDGLLWVIAGGVVYSIGAVILGLNRPHLIPGVFEAHALWHLCVLVGSACHVWFVLHYLVGGVFG